MIWYQKGTRPWTTTTIIRLYQWCQMNRIAHYTHKIRDTKQIMPERCRDREVCSPLVFLLVAGSSSYSLYDLLGICFWKDNKQRFLTPGHQGWNDLHRLCRIGVEYYLPNNDNNNNNSNNNNNNNNINNNNNNDNDNNNNKTMMMMITIIRMMTMMIIGTTTIMIMIIIITTTLTMTVMKMIMIKTAQTPCQSLY